MTETAGARSDAVLTSGSPRPVPPLRPHRRRAADPVTHLTRDERAARGAAARVLLPREALADVGSGFSRPDPIDLLVSQGHTRLPELVPLRYGRMVATPFTF